MTERPDPKPIMGVQDLMTQLPEQDHFDLGHSVGAGLFNGCLAAECLTDPGPKNENIPQIVMHLSAAIKRLSKAREITQSHS
jgi:hypothetical protein